MKRLLLLLTSIFLLTSCSLPNEADMTLNKETIKDYLFEEQHLALNGLNLSQVPDFDSLLSSGQREKIISINLANNQIKKISKGDFNNFPFLRELWLANNQIESLKLEDNLPSLMTLIANHNKINTIKLSEFPNLNYLHLGYNEIDSPSDIFKQKSLNKLELHKNSLKSISGIESLFILEHLSLDFNSLEEVLELRELKNLKFASVANNPLSKVEIERWIKFSQSHSSSGTES